VPLTLRLFFFIAKAEGFELSADAIIAAQSAPQVLSDEDL